MTSTGPAQAWAARQQPGRPLRWKALEAAAWEAHPRVHRALLPGRISWPAGVTVLAGLLFLLALAAWLYPISGYAVAAGGRFGDAGTPHERVVVSGWIFTGGTALHAVALLLWAATSRTRQYPLQLQGAVAVVLGAATLWQYAGLADSGSSAPSARGWAVPVVVSVGLGVVTLVAHALAPRPVRNTEPRVAVRRAIAELSEAERAAVRRDLGAALADLHARGVITDTELGRTRDAELGLLSTAVSERESTRASTQVR